jgi:hypothetical protein
VAVRHSANPPAPTSATISAIKPAINFALDRGALAGSSARGFARGRATGSGAASGTTSAIGGASARGATGVARHAGHRTALPACSSGTRSNPAHPGQRNSTGIANLVSAKQPKR